MIILVAFAALLVVSLFLAVLAVMLRLGLSPRQALLYTPLKLAYRIRDRAVLEARNAPAPVIYVITHQSRLDPALMLALLPDDTLHILDDYSATASWLEPFRGLARAIIFKPEHVFVSRRLVRVLKGKGRLAVYLPEAVEPDTRSFRLYRAVSRIAMQADAKIVPIYIGGARTLPLSLASERDAPRHLLPRLDIRVLEPTTIGELVAQSGNASMSASSALFDRVAEMRVHAKTRSRTLFMATRQAADRIGSDRPAIEDVVSGRMNYRSMLIGARVLAGRFSHITAPGEVVGLMLPNSNGLALTFVGLMSAGRTAAMINYTAGPANVTSAIATALVRTVISSRAFVDKAGLGPLVEAVEAGGAKLVWIEDLRDGASAFDKTIAALLWRRPVARQSGDSPAAIMFTSGSEGTPKAVALSHGNLIANAMQVEARIAIGPQDRLMNVLPAFHSFGLTGGLILPLLSGVPVMLYPSPLHTKIIPRVAAKFRPTFLLGTDTFLAAYGATAGDGDFSSLRFAVAGAEAVRDATKRAWQERFGVRILEGYGVTEASPVVALNTPIHDRDATVGRLVPGLRMRVEAVEGVVDGGRLWLSGPNIMLGTMSADRPGVIQPHANGWHDTGDIVSVDREGFVTLRGRQKRFAKIAGEMISLGAVEALASALWPDGRHAAVAVPDKRRGESIVLVTTTDNADASALRKHAKQAGAAEISLPQAIVTVPEIPILGTGKTDYTAVRVVALERLGLSEAA